MVNSISRALLPLYKVDINYIVRTGRRWSALEHLVLWACEREISAQELADQTDAPFRLVSEALVNLLKIGWVALRLRGDAAYFCVTEVGKRNAESAMPEHLLQPELRRRGLYFDRITGEFFDFREIDVVPRPPVVPSDTCILTPTLYNVKVSGPELVKRLLRGRGEVFDRLVDIPTPSYGEHFASLEIREGAIYGLPQRTPTHLRLKLTDLLSNQAPAVSSVMNLGDRIMDRRGIVSANITADDIIVGGPAHREYIESIFARARRTIIIHSPFIGSNIKSLIPHITAAAERGVQVYLFWGQENSNDPDEDNPSARAAAIALGAIRMAPEAKARLRMGETTTGSHAKIILADDGGDGFICSVGSCNWLSTPFRSIEVSLSVREPQLISDLALKLADVITPVRGKGGPVITKLLDISADQLHRPRTQNANARVAIVFDEDHLSAVRDAFRDSGAQSKIFMTSHKFGFNAESNVLETFRAAGRDGASATVLYTRKIESLTDEEAVRLITECRNHRVEVQKAHIPVHAKTLCWNNKLLLISSFNFLAASTKKRIKAGTEAGLLCESNHLVEIFRQKLTALGLNTPERLASSPKPGGRHNTNSRRRKRRANSRNSSTV